MKEWNDHNEKYPDEQKTAEEFLDYWHSYTTVPFGIDPKSMGEQTKYGYGVVDEKDELIRVVNRTNPNAKWDWYVVGGRWSGLIPTKDGQEVDEARKGDIDINEFMNRGVADRMAEYDALRPIMDAKGWTSWEKFRDVIHSGDPDAARDAFHSQPAKVEMAAKLEELRDGDKFAAMFFEWSDLELDRESYERKKFEGNCTFAFLDDEGWHERGSMGWWAMVSDENENWYDIWMERWDRLPDDTMIRAVDCHI